MARTSSGVAGRPPFLPRVLEIPDQFPLFRVHGHDGLPSPLESTHLPVDVLELGVAIRMRRPFAGLAVGLQAVIQVVEQGGHCPVADAVALAFQFLGQVAGTLARPAERGLRIAAGGRLDEGFEVLDQGGVRLFQEGTASSGMTAAFGEGGRRRAPSSGCRSSRRPAQMVVRDRPVASATKVTPPRSSVMASQAAQCRRIRSFIRGRSNSNLRRTASRVVSRLIL